MRNQTLRYWHPRELYIVTQDVTHVQRKYVNHLGGEIPCAQYLKQRWPRNESGRDSSFKVRRIPLYHGEVASSDSMLEVMESSWTHSPNAHLPDVARRGQRLLWLQSPRPPRSGVSLANPTHQHATAFNRQWFRLCLWIVVNRNNTVFKEIKRYSEQASLEGESAKGELHQHRFRLFC